MKFGQKKKAAWFPKRPFLSYGSFTFNGRSQGVRARGPISRLHPDRKPLLIGSVAILLPELSRWFPISVRWPYWAIVLRDRQRRFGRCPRCSRCSQAQAFSSEAHRGSREGSEENW